mgnify:CR=1 FL=1
MIGVRAAGVAGLVLALSLALAGCASPPARFYALAVTAVPDPASASLSDVVAVDSVAVPAAVDRPQFVVHKGANRVSVDEFNRWAAPLSSSIARTLADDLAILLGTPSAGRWPRASTRRTGSASTSGASTRYVARAASSTPSGWSAARRPTAPRRAAAAR